MRKITSEAKKAFEGGYKYHGTNTEVIINGDIINLYLFNNRIAWRDISKPGELYISNAGWYTSTTRERLNGLEDVHVQQKAGEWYLNGLKWTGEWTLLKDGKRSF